MTLLQPLAIGGVIVLAALLIEGTRWMVVFPALVLLLVVWFGQALLAYRRALALGAAGGGELQAALFLPFAAALISSFWLLGGKDGSPATVLGEYVGAWETGRPEIAARDFVAPPAPADLAARWALDEGYLRERVAAAAAAFGATSGIDPAQPFNSLRFSELPSTSADTAVVEIEIVRRQRVETVLLGFIPTATQTTVVVEEFGRISLRALPAPPPAWLPPIQTGARVWRIEDVGIIGAQAASPTGTVP